MKECVKYIWQLSRGTRFEILWVILLGITNVGLGLYFIWVCKSIVDIATRHEGSIWPSVGLMTVLMLTRLLLMGLRQYLVNHADIRMTNAVRHRLFRQVMNAPWTGRESMAVGDTMSRLGEDLRVVVSCLSSDLPSLILSLCQFVAASWFLLVLQPALLWVLVGLTPIALLLSKVYYKTTRRLSQQIRQEEADLTSHIQESLLNRALLLSLKRVPLMTERLENKQKQLYGTYSHRIGFMVQARLFIHIAFMGGYAASFIWGAYGIMSGTVTYGMMTAFLQLVAQVQHPILNMSELLPKLVQSTTSADRLRQLPEAPKDGDRQVSDADAELQDIVLENVSFRYPDGERDILHDFTLTIPAGCTIAIVGPTGSGKSTLVRILLGLMRPTKGRIDTGGQSIAYVPQGNSLIRGTIRDNILLGKLNATDNEIRDVLSKASALFVYDLPSGLDTMCGEKGNGLSEGQAQRIAIARALLQPGSVMILDEASSALDPQTERQILEEMQQTQSGKTMIWITHHEMVKEYASHVVTVESVNGL